MLFEKTSFREIEQGLCEFWYRPLCFLWFGMVYLESGINFFVSVEGIWFNFLGSFMRAPQNKRPWTHPPIALILALPFNFVQFLAKLSVFSQSTTPTHTLTQFV